ncbi:Uncharacterised protein [uncultured Comamonas sp.]|nr:Uncharacterised protein [uncultured Comamonas sp.]
MNNCAPLPSRRLHWLALFARWALRATLAAWLVFLLIWGGLHLLIVPRIPQWGAYVERWASHAIGAPVRIARLQAQANGLFPTLHLEGIEVLDAQQLPALRLPRVVLTVSPRSILRGGLEQLFIDAPVLDVRHLADGRWQVAGLTFDATGSSNPRALEWLLEQPELALAQGQIRFSDELQGQDITLHDVRLVLRGNHWRHALRLDAQDDQGQQLHATGLFRRPLLPGRQPVWERWSGQWFARLQLQQLPRLPWPAAWGIANVQGQGQARLWMDVHEGTVVGTSTDMALQQARVQWHDPAHPPLQLSQVQGRLSAQWQAGPDGAAPSTWAVQASDWGFTWHPQDAPAQPWPASNWSVQSAGADAQQHLRLQLAHADIGLARQLLAQLPVALPSAVQVPLQRLAPTGQIERLQLRWSHDRGQPRYQASGHLTQLQLRSQPNADEPATGVGIPGVAGLNLRFDLTEDGGSAELDMAQGQLELPGVFEDPILPLDQLQAQVRWTHRQGRWQVQVNNTQFANADAAGSLQAHWRTSDDSARPFPGVLDLSGRLTRADGTRVHRYLPLEIPAEARHYVRDSVRAGGSRDVRFAVQGDLRHLPFHGPGAQGRFYIAAQIADATYDYVPAALRPAGQAPWPVLHGLSGLLIFDGARMQVRDARTGFAGPHGPIPRLQLAHIHADIADLNDPVVHVQAQDKAPLNALLQTLRGSAIEQLTEGALAQARAEGLAQLQLQLQLPIAQLEKSTVQGQLQLQHNQLQLTPDTPVLRQAQGRITFSEHGFALQQVQAQALGGSVQLTGGMLQPQTGVQIQALGQASAAGLRAEAPLALVRQLAAHAQGSSAYQVDITALNSSLDVVVRSDLQGLALQLPAPLDKDLGSRLPLLVRTTAPANGGTELQVLLQDRGQLRYRMDAQGQVRSGFITLGDMALPPSGLPDGIAAAVRLPALDLDAWSQVLDDAGPADSANSSAAAPNGWAAYLPQRLQLDVQALRLAQRNLGPSSAQLTQRQGRWHGQLQAEQFAGYVEYHPADERNPGGLVFARLEHLHIPRTEVEHLQQSGQAPPAATGDWPALDVRVEQFTLADKPLGQLTLLARQRQPGNWALERLQLTTAETRWQAQGDWAAPTPGAPRRTHVDFTLETENAGQLLERLGMSGVVRNGSGTLHGQLGWQGSPATPHWPSMNGTVHLDMDKGQFLKADPGIARLLSVLSLQSISRRLSLDFRDVFNAGFAFDFVRGDIAVADGIARTNNLQMKGLNAAVLMEGQANLQDETQQLRLVVVPEINAMTASLVATAINPVIGLGSFIAQALLRGPAIAAATRTFDVTGSWEDPVVTPAAAPAAVPQESP